MQASEVLAEFQGISEEMKKKGGRGMSGSLIIY
jgi:hypothetical protein